MSEEEPKVRISIPLLAKELGDKDICPVCGKDWKDGACTHQGLYVDSLDPHEVSLARIAEWAMKIRERHLKG